MGQVDAFSMPGLRLWFNSSDHRPPHFHVKKPGAWEIRVFILTTQEKSLDYEMKVLFGNRGLTSKEQQKIAAGVVAHREQLQEEWENKVFVKERME